MFSFDDASKINRILVFSYLVFFSEFFSEFFPAIFARNARACEVVYQQKPSCHPSILLQASQKTRTHIKKIAFISPNILRFRGALTRSRKFIRTRPPSGISNIGDLTVKN